MIFEFRATSLSYRFPFRMAGLLRYTFFFGGHPLLNHHWSGRSTNEGMLYILTHSRSKSQKPFFPITKVPPSQIFGDYLVCPYIGSLSTYALFFYWGGVGFLYGCCCINVQIYKKENSCVRQLEKVLWFGFWFWIFIGFGNYVLSSFGDKIESIIARFGSERIDLGGIFQDWIVLVTEVCCISYLLLYY